MRKFRMIVLVAGWASAASAQGVPHDFKQDTPPVPGQTVEAPRDRLRLAPLPLRDVTGDKPGLPPDGPMGLVRESRNEWKYAPPADR
jgi:hypothetical protein